MLYNIYVES